MAEPAVLKAIFVCARAGQPMQALDSVAVRAGQGLEGDRYAAGIGIYSKVEPVKVRHATFIAQSAIDAAARWFAARGKPSFEAVETRRNLLLEGIAFEDLNALVGREFSLGGVRFRGIEPADPCLRPGRLLDRTGFDVAFTGMGGLRAEALSDGILRPGDRLA